MRLKLNPDNYAECPEYNEWLDTQYQEQFGSLTIFSFQPQPSEVLFTMSYATYQATFTDFIQQREDTLKEKVWETFPSPIAYYFYRFENGSENELQRLHFLRDTWESIIDILHALAVAEARHHGLTLSEPIKFKDLLTDKVAQRLTNIEAIIAQFQTAGVNSVIATIAPVRTLRTMAVLNQTRNAFSHSAAQSEAQAQNWINECIADMIDVLDDLQGFAELQIVRLVHLQGAYTLRFEPFMGHSSTKRFKTTTITQQQLMTSGKYLQQGQMLLVSRDSIFSLRPLVHYRDDSVGHTTRLCLFRKTHGDGSNRRIEYEVVGEASRINEDRVHFSTELTELRALFGLGPD
jgi:hypothetical protein